MKSKLNFLAYVVQVTALSSSEASLKRNYFKINYTFINKISNIGWNFIAVYEKRSISKWKNFTFEFHPPFLDYIQFKIYDVLRHIIYSNFRAYHSTVVLGHIILQ
jgi:hypothetical protein